MISSLGRGSLQYSKNCNNTGYLRSDFVTNFVTNFVTDMVVNFVTDMVGDIMFDFFFIAKSRCCHISLVATFRHVWNCHAKLTTLQ